MLTAGEDIKFIARRIMICASEDVGMADPMAIVVATSVSLAVERIGLPEARILLSEAAVYVAAAPKSNASYLAVGKALENVQRVKRRCPDTLRTFMQMVRAMRNRRLVIGMRTISRTTGLFSSITGCRKDEILRPTGLGYENCHRES